MFNRIRALFAPKSKIRNVKFYFLFNKILEQSDLDKLAKTLYRAYLTELNYSDITLTFSPNYVKKTWTYVKVCCTNSSKLIKESEVQEFYENLFEKCHEYTTTFFKKKGIALEIFDFRILFRIYPEEEPSEYTSLCKLDKISQKLTQKISTGKIPENTKEMILYLKELKPFKKNKILDISLKVSKKTNLQVYGSFGVRNEWSTELDSWPLEPDLTTSQDIQEESDPAEMVNLAIKLKNQERFEDALLIYDAILKTDPHNELVLLNKAILFKNMNKIDEAIKIYDSLLKKKPRDTYFLAAILANKGAALACIFQYEEAIELFNKALIIQPDELVTIKNKKDTLEQMNFQKNQSKTEKLIQKGLIVYLAGNADEAIKYFNEAITLEPKNKNAQKHLEEALIRKSIDLIDSKEYVKALVVLKKCLESYPKSESSYNNIGKCYEQLKDYDKALQNYTHALELAPRNSLILNNIGYTLFLMHRFDTAIEYFDKSLKMNPYNIRALNNRKMVFESLQVSSN